MSSHTKTIKELKYTIKTLIQGSSGSVFASSVFLIEIAESNIRILYDTSISYHKQKLMYALQNYGLNADKIDYIVLSHWHFDHCGSIECFPNSKVVLAQETFSTMQYFDQAIKHSLIQDRPIETLASILFERMNTNRQRTSKEKMNSDNYKYYHNFSKVRAIANIILNNEKIYSNIISKLSQNNLLIIKKPYFELSSLRLYKVNIHTEGDLILNLNTKDTNVYFLGDVLESLKDKSYYQLLTNPEISSTDKALLKTILKTGNKLITAHGKEYYVDCSSNLIPIQNNSSI
jgi:hypothetical protein